jgi:hypothetical protein
VSLAPHGKGSPSALDARGFFQALRELGPLRVISRSGASTFEAICELGPFGVAGGYLNAITPAYHWHVELARFRHLRACDQVHERSGRRVLFFELRERPDFAPFLWIYLHRERGEEFAAEREARFAALHRELSSGVELAETEA